MRHLSKAVEMHLTAEKSHFPIFATLHDGYGTRPGSGEKERILHRYFWSVSRLEP